MTNETEAPERIWVCTHLGEYGRYYPEAVEAEGGYGGVAISYVPETISDAKDARIAELEAKLNWVLIERDETFALMLDRVRTAEAKLAKAVRLMELSVELAHWNTTLLDDVILFITELKELT